MNGFFHARKIMLLGGMLLLVAAAAAVLLLRQRFHEDVAAASVRAARGNLLAQTRCGPIEYQTAGHGVPLFMIHGSGGGHDQGMLFARAFTRHGVRVIAVSRFGYLRTPLPADASAQAQADAHACLLDALGIRRAAVLGASAGALSAMQMAIRHPHRVSALILLVPITYTPDAAAAAAARSTWSERLLLSLIGSDFIYWSAMHVARNTLIRHVLATPPQQVAAASPAEQARVNAMIDVILPVSLRAEGLRNETRVIKHLEPYDLAAIRAPTLVISTRDDGYGTYANAEYTSRRIADARLVGYPHGGHLWVGHDGAVRQEILKLLRTTEGPGIQGGASVGTPSQTRSAVP